MILITGANGQLGTAFRSLLPEAAVLTRADLDLTSVGAIPVRLAELTPSVIINCAAYTAVDQAEEEPDLANQINANAVRALAEYAAGVAVPLVTFSTDYVFDGTATHPYVESSPPHPINAYGRSKLAGERAATLAYPEVLIVRTSWVFSATHRNFVKTILAAAAERRVRVVADQSGCPTFAPDLAAATLRAIQEGVTGTLHITNSGPTTWFELAREVCAAAGIDPDRIEPITTEEFPTRAPRPRYSVLGSERRAGLDPPELRPWRDAVRAALESSLGT